MARQFSSEKRLGLRAGFSWAGSTAQHRHTTSADRTTRRSPSIPPPERRQYSERGAMDRERRHSPDLSRPPLSGYVFVAIALTRARQIREFRPESAQLPHAD